MSTGSAPADPEIEGSRCFVNTHARGKDECNAPEGSQLSGLVAIPKLLDVDRRRLCKARSRSEGVAILQSDSVTETILPEDQESMEIREKLL